MKTRPSRLLAAIVTLFSMLFMQLAVAAYECPALETGHGKTALLAADSNGDMSSCADADPDQPNLCQAHDQAGNQSLDKPAAPLLQPFIATSAWRLVPPDPAPPYASTSHLIPSLEHAIAPPLAIRNCCLRH
ncbi:hypothetical protein [Pseudoduganella sp. GCM10020061]|uniref:hypothetical protein n=1 Tax=Pseudoduganella sp. GCM10020061 TaxID=3317345 RepID=UPI003628A218